MYDKILTFNENEGQIFIGHSRMCQSTADPGGAKQQLTQQSTAYFCNHDPVMATAEFM